MIAPPQPIIQPIGGKKYRLVADYRYEWDHEGRRYMILIPKEFVFDMASVPRLLWALIAPFDLGPAALVHDWLYDNGGDLSGDWPPPADSGFRYSVLLRPVLASFFVQTANEWRPVAEPWTRKDADRLFARMMRESRVCRWRRRAAYLAVRLFGWTAWERLTPPSMGLEL